VGIFFRGPGFISTGAESFFRTGRRTFFFAIPAYDMTAIILCQISWIFLYLKADFAWKYTGFLSAIAL
jgi:hypothetical protein